MLASEKILLTVTSSETCSIAQRQDSQDIEIIYLKKKLQVRDQQQADVQAKWNFHSFKYQLLIDMVGALPEPSTHLEL